MKAKGSEQKQRRIVTKKAMELLPKKLRNEHLDKVDAWFHQRENKTASEEKINAI